MRMAGFYLGSTIALTVLFYLAAYFFLPPPPPSPAMMVLFSGIAASVVWVFRWLAFRRQKKANASSHKALHILLFVLGSMLWAGCANAQDESTEHTCRFIHGPLAGTMKTFRQKGRVMVGSPCQDGQGSDGVVVDVDNSYNYARPPRPTSPAAPAAPAAPGAPGATTRPPDTFRATGITYLFAGNAEEKGFGLYSYVLLPHRPVEDEEYARDLRLLVAVLSLPSAKDVAQTLPNSRINNTYVLAMPDLEDLRVLHSRFGLNSLRMQAIELLTDYDYGRSAALLARLSEKVGPGPLIVSVLSPLTHSDHPHPVLLVDLSTAQPVLMESYVKNFTDRAAKDHFWEANTLDQFTLEMRNVLETAAIGLGMSKDAAGDWVHYEK